MIRNSIRQMFRTKMKTVLFFLLMTFCTLLICLGSNLTKQCRVNMETFKDAFVTIGIVEQNPVSYVTKASYDAYTRDYTYYIMKEYGTIFPMSELNMEGVDYISGPERRPCYSACIPNYKMIDDNAGYANEIVVEASPVEDCIPNGPVKMKVAKVLYSIYQLNVDFFYFCDHNNDNPQKMYADKTYIMSLYDGLPHGFGILDYEDVTLEYVPGGGPCSYQTDADGNSISTLLEEKSFEEVNDEFYEKGHDKYWKAYVDEKEKALFTVPVTATDDLNLLLPFYNGDITIKEGEPISEEDFRNGNPVCLISAQFAHRNGIKAGDRISLPLRTADYSDHSRYTGCECFLTAEGSNYKTFFTEDYTVKGIYISMPSGGTDKSYALNDNEFIIPKASIKADDSGNISKYGTHVSPYNTSFRIENGKIADFMEKWEAKGRDDVTIRFYDRGYSKLMDGIAQMEHMATLLLVVGVVMTVLVLVFFCSMMIGGQKKRTAIERSLGASKKECVGSLMTGILITAAAGCMIGCLLGLLMTRSVSGKLSSQQIFDRTFSAGILNSEIEEEQVSGGDIFVTLVSFLGVFSFTAALSGVAVWRNLKYEPLELLSGKK